MMELLDDAVCSVWRGETQRSKPRDEKQKSRGEKRHQHVLGRVAVVLKQ
jgi:hypothetical protein